MPLPVTPPLAPQLARAREELPEGPGWAYEPKLDGFRVIAFVDGGELTLLSRGGKDLTRYFPEVTLPQGRYVLDGELLIDAASGAEQPEDFGALQQRIHPAASRIRLLSETTPARLAAFDLLAHDDRALLDRPYRERRRALEDLIAGLPVAGHPLSLVPSVADVAVARGWLSGAHEGVVAKEVDAPYLPGQRRGAVKVKRRRTADCVVVGYREGKEPGTVGSLMLALHDTAGRLQVVGHTSGLKAAEKRALVDELAPLATGEHGTAEPSRWRPDDALAWVALRPERVVEVTFDQVSGGRIRHGARLVRWRDDKAPSECLMDQLEG